jgi:hypothetical protein
MEPVFMILGESSATAAALAIDGNLAVQDVPYAKLREALLKQGQILEYKSAGAALEKGAVDPTKLAGVVVDDDDAKVTGEWQASHAGKAWVGAGYRHDGNAKDGKFSAYFETILPKAGKYEVRIAYSPNGNRATNVPVVVRFAGGEKTVKVNQQKAPPIDGLFISLGTFEFSAKEPAVVIVSNKEADGYVIIDAVQWLGL